MTCVARRAGADSEATRRRLLDVAEEQFAHWNYSGATNQTIAEAAGVTTGSIYHYFGSKADLYARVCERAMDRLVESALSQVGSRTSFKDAVKAFLALAASHNRAYPHTAGLLANQLSEARQHPETREVVDKTQQRIRELLSAVVVGCRNDPILDGLDTEDVVDLLVAVTDGFARFAVRVDTEHEERMLSTFALMLGTGP